MTETNLSLAGGSELVIPAAGYIASAVILFLIGFFGFFLNLFVIIVIWRDKHLWTPLNMILFNLVCSDWLVSILGNPWSFASALSYTWIFGKVMCEFYGFIMSLLGITSITSLSVLALERYMMISKPFRNHSLSRRGAGYLILAIWIYSLALTTPPLIGWGEYVTEAANISCSVNWEEKAWNSTTYILYLFAFGLFLPLTAITYSYVNIILTMKGNALKLGRVNKAEGKVACMVLVMIVAFLVAWSPYAILSLIVQFGDASYVTPGMAVVPALVAKSSICYNPIIYVGLNTQFRKSWKPGKKRVDHTSEEGNAVATSKFYCQDQTKSEKGDAAMAEGLGEVRNVIKTDDIKV